MLYLLRAIYPNLAVCLAGQWQHWIALAAWRLPLPRALARWPNAFVFNTEGNASATHWLRLEPECSYTQIWVLVAVRRRRIWIDSHVREPATLARQCLATLGLSVAFSTVKGRATLTLSVKLSVSNFFQCSLQRWWPCCARIWLCNSIAHVRCLQPMCLLFWFDFLSLEFTNSSILYTILLFLISIQ